MMENKHEKQKRQIFGRSLIFIMLFLAWVGNASLRVLFGYMGASGVELLDVPVIQSTMNALVTIFLFLEVSGLIVPGGESTTISKLLQKNHLYDPVRKEAEEGMPIMGTCAGCILLAKEGDEAVMKTQTQLLSIMDMAVVRNAFGRQRESFEADLEIEGLDSTFRGVFIRAPAISKVWGNCSVLSNFNGKIVMANQGSMLALAFHPELSGDTRIHELFLDMI